jgi:hypothetical protein
MPEGGNLITGMAQVVAFKAVGTDGKSTDIEGYISDKDGNHICDIKSIHNGMGHFILTAKPEEKYTATVTSSRAIPQPLSVTRIKVTPPFFISTVIRVEPASIEFSTNSLITDDGRSTTSPAAINSATCLGNTLITDITATSLQKNHK